jgi:hypothetical protein
MIGMIFAPGYQMLSLKHAIALSGLMFLACSGMHSQKMDNQRLYQVLQSVSDSIQGPEGFWQVKYADRVMFVITDENFDRMRIISPVTSADQLSSGELRQAMIANFHSALDVRYAISEDILWSAFIHPLGSLTEGQARDAISQVYQAAETFGTTFSSTDLVFPGSSGESNPVGPIRKKM